MLSFCQISVHSSLGWLGIFFTDLLTALGFFLKNFVLSSQSSIHEKMKKPEITVTTVWQNSLMWTVIAHLSLVSLKVRRLRSIFQANSFLCTIPGKSCPSTFKQQLNDQTQIFSRDTKKRQGKENAEEHRMILLSIASVS